MSGKSLQGGKHGEGSKVYLNNTILKLEDDAT
jgi:hypothetical protein